MRAFRIGFDLSGTADHHDGGGFEPSLLGVRQFLFVAGALCLAGKFTSLGRGEFANIVQDVLIYFKLLSRLK